MNVPSSDVFQLETERLILRQLNESDADFILELVNDPDWIRYIGDRGIRTLGDASDYLNEGPLASYAQNGFGLWLVQLKDATPIGMCGLINREGLNDVDLGFAFMPTFRSQGYAHESASIVIEYAKRSLELKQLAAITDRDNAPSIKLLEKLGFQFEKMIDLFEGEPAVNLFMLEL